jgi:hypothetical protein
MTRFVPAGILFAALLVTAAAVSCLTLQDHHGGYDPLKITEFQRLVGGLGLGPATNMSECSMLFDPRIAGTCPYQYEPIPAGRDFFCSRHSCSILTLQKFPLN